VQTGYCLETFVIAARLLVTLGSASQSGGFSIYFSVGLHAGEDIQAQTHDDVTMLFSDIVGFTAICSTATPLEVITMLQSLYNQFDQLCGLLDVYKVRDWQVSSCLTAATI